MWDIYGDRPHMHDMSDLGIFAQASVAAFATLRRMLLRLGSDPTPWALALNSHWVGSQILPKNLCGL